MALKERVKSVIEQYGFTIEVGVPTYTTNSYGEKDNYTVNYTQEKAISTDTSYSYNLGLSGVLEDVSSGLILPYDTSVTKDSFIKFDNKEFKVADISPVKFKGEDVVYLLKLE